MNVYAAEEQVSSYAAQLTTLQKEIYNNLVEHYLNDDGTYTGVNDSLKISIPNLTEWQSTGEMQQEVNKLFIDVEHAYYAFVHDYPQIFWTNSVQMSYQSVSRTYSDGTVTYQISQIEVILVDNITLNKEEIDNYFLGIQSAAEEIINNLPNNPCLFDYYKEIHDWIANKAKYSQAAVQTPSQYAKAYTSYPLFGKQQDGSVVCEGYGEAYKILCDYIKRQCEVDLSCMLIVGKGVSSSGNEAHLWNVVKMPDDEWYGVDVTWDDVDGTWNSPADILYTYFLCGKNSLGFTEFTFEQDHLEENEVLDNVTFDCPVVEDYGYNGFLDDAVTWNYDNGTLTIAGTGTISEYVRADRVPWRDYQEEIKSVVIGENVAGLSEGLFSDSNAIEEMIIPYVGLSKDATGERAVLGAIFGTDSNGILQYHTLEEGQLFGKKYDVPASLKRITVTNDDDLWVGAFSNCSNLQSVILNQGIKRVGYYSLYNCSSLMDIVIPDSVTIIEEAALYGCDNLKSITLPFIGGNENSNETEDAVLGYIFGYHENGIFQFHVFNGTSGSGTTWNIPSRLQSIIITQDTTISFGAFSNCINIKEITLKANVETIDKLAFYQCTGLQSVTFMGGAPEIESNAFSGCGILTANILGSQVWPDSVKQNYGAEKINWNIKNSTDLVAKISSAKISLGDKIAVKFMVTLDESVSDDDYMKVTTNGVTKTIQVKDTSIVKSDLTGEEKHVFVCEVNAREMTRTIQAQMVVGDVEGSVVTYSVKKYADTILGLASGTYEAEKTMIRAMLNYGGYAQTFFEDASVLANANLYEDSSDPVLTLEKPDLEAYQPSGFNTVKLEATLILESETELRFYFQPESGTTLEDYSIEVTGTDKQYKTGVKVNKCYISIPGICADELQDMYTVTIREKDTNNIYATITYGALSYVRTVLNDNTAEIEWQNLVKALYLYNQAALDYSK